MKEKTWKEIPIGGLIIEAGNAKNYQTGDWRTFKPIWSEEECIHCLICWANCPDTCVLISEDKMTGINYDHCKGCGICEKICPKDAIKMVKEVK